MIYIDLLLGFLKVGLFSFGGAYAAIPLIRDVVLHYGWIDDEQLAYMIAVSESTPGPIMVNMATYVGSMTAGIPGALIATFSVVLPAFVIIILIMIMFKRLLKNPYAQAVLRGLKPCIMGIILAMGISMIAQNVIVKGTSFSPDLKAAVICSALAAVYFGSRKIRKSGISPIVLICIAAVMGVIVY
ncbi:MULTISPECIES: chromate transporter [unclassified Butyrivibrio]|uniref:chromate transporter n=1 Tax=unclassified Butyrivibrio TaxID=2639466 RepID=UPI0003B45E0E|nr:MULTISPECIES: chromate transporter [unclassified Butyrivibrio]SDB57450.1 chromate transporter [Butyrivibrio sp. INlla16]